MELDEAGSGASMVYNDSYSLEGWGGELLECLSGGNLSGNAFETSSGEMPFGSFWGSALISMLSDGELRDTYYSLGAAFGAAIAIALGISVQKMAIERTLAKPPPLRWKCWGPSLLWVFGLTLHLVGGLLEVCALTLAPQQLVTAVGATSLLWGLAFSACMHRGGLIRRWSCSSTDFWLAIVAICCTVLAAAGLTVSIADVAVVGHWSRGWARSSLLVTARWRQIDPWPVLIPVLSVTAVANLGCCIYDLKLQMQRRLKRRISRAPRGSSPRMPGQKEVSAALGSVSKCSLRMVRFLYPLASGLDAAWCVFFAGICSGLAYPTLVDGSVRDNAYEWQTYAYGVAGLALLPLQLLWLSRALVYFDALYVLPAFYIPLLAASTASTSVFFDDMSCIGLYSQRAGLGGGSLALLLLAEILLLCMSTSKRHNTIVMPSTPAATGNVAERWEGIGGTPKQSTAPVDDFDRADTDRDGIINEEEFAAAYAATVAAATRARSAQLEPAQNEPRPRTAEPSLTMMVPYENNRLPPPLPAVPPRPGRGPALPPIGGQVVPYLATAPHDAMVMQQMERQSMMLDRVARDVAALREEKMLETQAVTGDRRSLRAPSTLPLIEMGRSSLGYSGGHDVVPAYGHTMQAHPGGGAMELMAGQVVVINNQPYMLVEEDRERVAEL